MQLDCQEILAEQNLASCHSLHRGEEKIYPLIFKIVYN